MKTPVLVLTGLVLTGCAAKAPVVSIPLGVFAYELGYNTARVEQLCKAKKLPQADCDHAKELGAAAKAKLDATPATPFDWAEMFGKLLGMAAKAAI